MTPLDHPDFVALVDDVARNGILEPLMVTKGGDVVDGRHRLRAAITAGLDTVPTVLVDDSDAKSIAIRTLILRRHLSSKGAVAYVAFPLFRDDYEAATKARGAHLRRGLTTALVVGESEGIPELAQQLGICAKTFLQAAKIHALFESEPSLRDEWEPKILSSDDPVGLGAVIAGIGGARASRGVTPVRNSAFHRWVTAWKGMPKAAASWSKWTDEQKDEGVRVLTSAFTHLPDHMLDAMSAALRAARRARNAGQSEE